jgi:hypothetical protein
VWLAANLEATWSHPLNQGWMHYFHRWTSMPSFRRWWPVLSPIYGARFGDFVRARFDLPLEPDTSSTSPALNGDRARIDVRDAVKAELLLEAPPALRRWLARVDDSQKLLQCRLRLERQGARPPGELVVGALAYTTLGNQCAWWNVKDLYIPPALEGAGFTRRFLDGIALRLKGEVQTLRVVLRKPSTEFARRPPIVSPAERAMLIQAIALYKSRGFDYPDLDDSDEETLAPPTDALEKALPV